MSTGRLSIDDYFISMAELIATRSTCMHRRQGVALVRDGRVVATGYNGSPPGQPHCIDLGYCPKEKLVLRKNAAQSYCRAEGLHGESNAIASAAKMGISTNGATAYCVFSPCRACCNLLKSAGVVKVVFRYVYDGFVRGSEYLRGLGIEAREHKEGECEHSQMTILAP